MKTLLISWLCWLFSVSTMAQVVPMAESSKKLALQYIRKLNSEICPDKTNSYIPTVYFQSELFAIDKKYTMELLERTDKRYSQIGKESTIFPLTRSRCKYDLRFSTMQLDNFILCEAIPKGDK